VRSHTLCLHMLSLIHIVHARCKTVPLPSVSPQQHYGRYGRTTSGLRSTSKGSLLAPTAVIAACLALLDPELVRRQGGMQPSVARGDKYRDDSYAGDGYTGGAYTAGSELRSLRCVLL
jgi:hypothetical protein